MDSTASEPPHKLQWQKLSRSNGGRQPNAIRAGGAERNRASKAQTKRRDRERLKTAFRGIAQRGPERQACQTTKSITQALKRPWGTTTVTRWGLLGGLNHCVAWCLVRRKNETNLKLERAGFYESLFRCPTSSWQLFQNFGSWSLRLDTDCPGARKRLK